VKSKRAVSAVVFLALFAGALSFIKFDHCYNKEWLVPDVYTHACYSDIPALFGARDLINHTWPYSSATNSVEYPPVTGVVMWATSLITPHGSQNFHIYFLINIFLLLLLFVGSALLVWHMNSESWHLFVIAPAVVASLYINWDMWAVATALGAIYWFDRKKYDYSAIALGISIATKFFPIVLLIPVGIIFWKRAEIRSAIRYLFISVGLWVLINLPFALFTSSGWWRFFKLNGTRGADFGSIYYSSQLLGISIPAVNVVSILLFLMGSTVFGIFVLQKKYIPTLAQIAFIEVAIFTLASKVYSPQYILWLTPLAVIALGKKDRSAFWIWQGAEIMYHLAVWEYLATYSGGRFGLPAGGYAVISVIRIVALVFFVLKTAPSTREVPAQEQGFSLSAP
jgi:uncharacterized membrane protein